ncbi:hypothetical protein JAAARDRAFT_73974 [Jaapia argillacea MUCL 33604]|uniref:Uncharacterized protein n=1 Tax=Jaapia argillacea MUCL 33604 TaxID=933084 RepID=A0A067P7Z2_9AGAM|nr:hypothetical protein JAAARDRAFT_73974 [Jaapia argillacea MUCL 33604]
MVAYDSHSPAAYASPCSSHFDTASPDAPSFTTSTMNRARWTVAGDVPNWRSSPFHFMDYLQDEISFYERVSPASPDAPDFPPSCFSEDESESESLWGDDQEFEYGYEGGDEDDNELIYANDRRMDAIPEADSPTLLEFIERTLTDARLDTPGVNEVDNQLLLAPLESFAAMCWADAVDDEQSPTTSEFHSIAIRSEDGRAGSDEQQIGDDQEDGDEPLEGMTFADVTCELKSVWEEDHDQDTLFTNSSESTRHAPSTIEINHKRQSIEVKTRNGRRVSFILLDPQAPTTSLDPKGSIHFSPTKPKKKPSLRKMALNGLRRLASFRRSTS